MRPDGLGRNEWMEKDKKAEIKVEKKKAKSEEAKGESK
jgi:hypothetical protein